MHAQHLGDAFPYGLTRVQRGIGILKNHRALLAQTGDIAG
jgi:hypothetical protein